MFSDTYVHLNLMRSICTEKYLLIRKSSIKSILTYMCLSLQKTVISKEENVDFSSINTFYF